MRDGGRPAQLDILRQRPGRQDGSSVAQLRGILPESRRRSFLLAQGRPDPHLPPSHIPDRRASATQLETVSGLITSWISHGLRGNRRSGDSQALTKISRAAQIVKDAGKLDYMELSIAAKAYYVLTK